MDHRLLLSRLEHHMKEEDDLMKAAATVMSTADMKESSNDTKKNTAGVRRSAITVEAVIVLAQAHLTTRRKSEGTNEETINKS
jgi:hypothetical protein